MRVIGYASRTLSAAEKDYYLYSRKFEFLTLKWALCSHFCHFLYYAPSFTVFTDNNPLTYLLSTAKFNATGHRWVSELAHFRLTVKHRRGKINLDTDALSRMPSRVEEMIQSRTSEVSSDILQATAAAMSIDNNDLASWVMCLPKTVDVIAINQHTANQNLSNITLRDIMQDPVIVPAL